MKRWEYKTISLINGLWFDTDEECGPPTTFNELGEQGWEFVEILPSELVPNSRFEKAILFKRPFHYEEV